MKRRDFIGHAGCGLATVLAASGIPAAAQTQGQTSGAKEPGVRPPTRFYRIRPRTSSSRSSGPGSTGR